MLTPLKSVWQFLNYWYFRYLMVTELYMVEKWERVVANTTIILMCLILSYFNYLLLTFTSSLSWMPSFLTS